MWGVWSTKSLKVFQTDKTRLPSPTGWLSDDFWDRTRGDGRAPGWSVRSVKFGGSAKEVMTLSAHFSAARRGRTDIRDGRDRAGSHCAWTQTAASTCPRTPLFPAAIATPHIVTSVHPHRATHYVTIPFSASPAAWSCPNSATYITGCAGARGHLPCGFAVRVLTPELDLGLDVACPAHERAGFWVLRRYPGGGG